MNRTIRICALWVGAAIIVAGPIRNARAEGIDAVTKPSADVVLSFLVPGKIAEVAVKEGQTVKAGDLLVRLDDRVERAQLKILKAQAGNTVSLKAAVAQLAQANVDLGRDEAGYRKKVVTIQQLQHSRLEVAIDELRVELARLELKLAGLRYDEARLQLEHMRLETKIDGRVEKIQAEVGGSVDKLTAVARVVRIVPLWIDVEVPVSLARTLSKGRTALVRYRDDKAAGTETGTVINIDSVASAVNTLRVRVELPNRSNRPAGLHVLVDFPPPAKAAAKSGGATSRPGRPKGKPKEKGRVNVTGRDDPPPAG